MASSQALDYEAAPSHSIEVRRRVRMARLPIRHLISVTDDPDEHDVSDISDTDSSPNQVEENSAVGTAVGITASASDADAADTVTYELSNDAGGLFKINGDGEVTVNGSLDYEAVGGASHDITVLAKSTDGSFSTKSFTISVVDDPDEHDISDISEPIFLQIRFRRMLNLGRQLASLLLQLTMMETMLPTH